jgi:DUF4097 and DUF4098 domain-containing protein YvlB
MRRTSRRDASRCRTGRIRSPFHSFFFAAGTLAAALGLSSCNGDLFSGGQQAQEEFFFEVDATGRTEFRLEGINGNIDVIAEADAEEVVVGGFKRVRSSSLADAQAQLDRLEVDVGVEGDAIVIRTEQPSDTEGRTFEVEYNLIVPERLEGDVQNVNGNILIDAMGDDLEVSTTNGNITVQDHFGSATVTTTNGNLVATVTISSGGEILMTAVNGGLELDIPSITSATFAARLANGDITTSNLSLSDAQSTPFSLTGVLGDGDGEIDIETVNGNIVVQGF